MYPCCIRSSCSNCVFIYGHFWPSTNCFIQPSCSFLTQHCLALQCLSLTLCSSWKIPAAVSDLHCSHRAWSDPSACSCPPFAQEKLSLLTECSLCLSRHVLPSGISKFPSWAGSSLSLRASILLFFLDAKPWVSPPQLQDVCINSGIGSLCA